MRKDFIAIWICLYATEALKSEYPNYMKPKKPVVRENIGEIVEYKYYWRKAFKEQIKKSKYKDITEWTK